MTTLCSRYIPRRGVSMCCMLACLRVGVPSLQLLLLAQHAPTALLLHPRALGSVMLIARTGRGSFIAQGLRAPFASSAGLLGACSTDWSACPCEEPPASHVHVTARWEASSVGACQHCVLVAGQRPDMQGTPMHVAQEGHVSPARAPPQLRGCLARHCRCVSSPRLWKRQRST